MSDLASEWLRSERHVDKQICYSKLAENDGSHSREAYFRLYLLKARDRASRIQCISEVDNARSHTI